MKPEGQAEVLAEKCPLNGAKGRDPGGCLREISRTTLQMFHVRTGLSRKLTQKRPLPVATE